MLEILLFLGFALLLGFKHSFDLDHLLTVSNFLTKSGSLKSAFKTGASWALGHIVTTAAITILLFVFRESLLNKILTHFDKIAGVMIIVIGIITLKNFFVIHRHKHKHGKKLHSHLHIHTKIHHSNHLHNHLFGIGIIQGLASNNELFILLTASLGISTIGSIILGIGAFSIGTILGMILFSLIFSYQLIKAYSGKIYKFVTFSTGFLSIVYGCLVLL